MFVFTFSNVNKLSSLIFHVHCDFSAFLKTNIDHHYGMLKRKSVTFEINFVNIFPIKEVIHKRSSPHSINLKCIVRTISVSESIYVYDKNKFRKCKCLPRGSALALQCRILYISDLPTTTFRKFGYADYIAPQPV